MLNNDSFAKSVVGRTGSFPGATMRFPLKLPDTILIGLIDAMFNAIFY